MKRRIIIVAVLALCAWSASGAWATSSSTLMVNNNPNAKGGGCKNAPYQDIQSAVNAASPGDTVKVCPGEYAGGVTIDKAITVLGTLPGKKLPKARSCSDGDDPHQYTLVTGSDATPGFIITSDGVTLTGFTIYGTSNDAGVRVSGFQSVTISLNRIRDNTIGIYANSPSTVSSSFGFMILGNCIQNNNVTSPGPGSGAGNGISSDNGFYDSTIDRNTFRLQQNAGILLLGTDAQSGGCGGCVVDSNVIKRNTSDHDGPFIFTDFYNSSVQSNTNTDSAGSGIYFGGSGYSDSFDNNTISNCNFTGINITAGYTGTPGHNFDVSGNKISGCGDAGIRIRDGSNNMTIENNKVQKNGFGSSALADGAGSGISDENTTSSPTAENNLFAFNQSKKNNVYGLFSNSTSSGNQWNSNRSGGNGIYDCDDDSTGSGTSGTDNSWSHDQGTTVNVVGICTKKGN